MDDLKSQAAELGISVDNRWGKDRLREEIAKAIPVAPSRPAERLIAVRVLRDFWNDDGERIRKGTVAEVPVEAALDGVESGALSRVK